MCPASLATRFDSRAIEFSSLTLLSDACAVAPAEEEVAAGAAPSDQPTWAESDRDYEYTEV